MTRKTFERGEAVEVRPYSDSEWRRGVYGGPSRSDHGWHHVYDDSAFRERFYVPSRRIRKRSK